MTACGTTRMSAKDAITNAMDAIIKLDTITMKKYFTDASVLDSATSKATGNTSMNGSISKIVEKITFKILTCEENGNSAVVALEITNVDMSSVMGKYLLQAISEAFSSSGDKSLTDEEQSGKFLEIFDTLISEETLTVTNSVVVNMTYQDDHWLIVTDDAFVNAVLGGFPTSIKNLGNSINGTTEESEVTTVTTESTADETTADTASTSMTNTGTTRSATTTTTALPSTASTTSAVTTIATAAPTEDVASKIMDINNWLVGDIWNLGFCNISHYLSEGKDACGESMDINLTLSQLSAAMGKKSDYDSYMANLPAEYADIAAIYSKVSTETDSLYAIVQSTEMTAACGTGLDTGVFTQYRDAFSDAAYNIYY